MGLDLMRLQSWISFEEYVAVVTHNHNSTDLIMQML